MPEEELADDYLSAAAGVVEAARNLDATKQEYRRLNEAATNAYAKQADAEKALSEALDKLKQASTGRK